MINIKRIIYILLTLTWMIVIFSFSADPADDSSEKSMGIGYVMASIFVPGFDDWKVGRQQEFVKKIEHPVRKVGHAAEYAVLGFLCMGTCWTFHARHKKRHLFLIAWAAATLYAASDELHQWFVPGRSCQCSDVCLDSIGALAGIGVYLLGQRLFKQLFPQSHFCGTLISNKNDRRNGV